MSETSDGPPTSDSPPSNGAVRVGLTLPAFIDDPGVVVSMARSAEAAGLDGVFTYDHLYRIASDGAGPALALEPVLGALAVETRRIVVGSLVARGAIRHPATLRASLDTVARIAPGRLVAGLGSGDALSDPEQAMFGLPLGGHAVRLGALEATAEALRERAYDVWIGGRSDRILATAAALADGWNGWNLDPATFSAEVRRLEAACRAASRASSAVTVSWGGLVELRPERAGDVAARPDVVSGSWDEIAASLRSRREAGADWLIVAPLDAANPEHPHRLAEELLPRLRDA